MQLRRPRALRPRLPGRTVRARLTWLYGSLFLASGAVLLIITGALWAGATDGKTAGFASTVAPRILDITGVTAKAGSVFRPAAGPGGSGRHATGGLARTQNLVVGQLKALTTDQQSSDLHQLLLYSGIALAIMAIVAIGLGWLTAGRVLRPLRTITSTARDISATNLDERLGLHGPNDELKELGDTFDQLLGRLERAFASQRRFVANASHELRTPLATMRAAIDVAVAKPAPAPPETVLLAGRLRQELDRVDGLLESFLALARAEAGPPDDDGPTSLDPLVTSALEARARTIASMRLDVHRDMSAETTVAGNRALLVRMVDNLVSNAVRHNEPGGWIGIRSELDGTMARLVVENGGPVLDQGEVDELAKPFRRLGADRTSSGEGFGLGLSIIASIVETHHGYLQLRARKEGGLQVSIELPLAVRVLSGAPA
jgi:signal transduction histidine kinase